MFFYPNIGYFWAFGLDPVDINQKLNRRVPHIIRGLLSYGRAGVAFTIAAIILISGLFVHISVANPSPQAMLIDDSYFREFQTQSFGVAPKSTTIKTFEADKNQKLSLNLNIGNSGPQSQSSSIIRTVINVTDSNGDQLVYDNNVGNNYSIQPILIKNNGTVSVAITNQEDYPLSVTMYLRQSGQPPSFGMDTAITTFANWLMIISAPVFGLGIWLVISERRKKGTGQQTPSLS
jgi:hypothetical protein